MQYTAVLTTKEVQLIQEFTGESKGESTKGGPTRREGLLQKVISAYRGPYRKRDGLPWIRKVKRLTGLRDVTLDEIRDYFKDNGR